MDSEKKIRNRYQEYIDRMVKIRRLATPPLEEVSNADDYSEHLRDNFIKIGQMAAENREFLDQILYPILQSGESLTDQQIQEMMTFGNELISEEILENLDLPVMSLLIERLVEDARKKEDLPAQIRQMDAQIGICYELMNMTKRIMAYPEISEHYRELGFKMGNFFLEMLEKEKFLQLLDEESREIVLNNVRYSYVFYEDQEKCPEHNEKQLAFLERMIEISGDSFYLESVPDFDWDYFLFRTLIYYAMTTECHNSSGFSAEQLHKICERTKELSVLWESNKEYYQELFPEVYDWSYIQVMYARNRYLSEEISKTEYQKTLIEFYRNRDALGYRIGEVYLNIIVPIEYLCLLTQDHVL